MATGIKPLTRLCLPGLHSAQLQFTVVAVERREPNIPAGGIWEEAKQAVKVIATVKSSNAAAQGASCPYFSGKVEGDGGCDEGLKCTSSSCWALHRDWAHRGLPPLRCLNIATQLLRTALP